MLYIIGAIILLAACFIFGGENGCGCALFLIIGFILWRIGLLGWILGALGWILRMLFKVLQWILIRLINFVMNVWDFIDQTVLNFIVLAV
ncbi:hypothetical protein ACIQ4Z_22755 [Peribacillus asahii]|uniref:hypothetical protein n=1 Tax=Peribacillus asahii TaxID=228899 RepID=UPI0038081094